MNCPCGFCSDWNSTIWVRIWPRALRKAANPSSRLPDTAAGSAESFPNPLVWQGKQVSSEFLAPEPHRAQGI